MVVEKVWMLSDDNRQVIKKNAQKIKDFLTLKKAYNCTEFYNWCNYYDHDFLGYIEKFLPFIKEEWKYISNNDIQDLIHEIDSAIENIKTCITIDDFDDEDDLIEFINEKYNDKNFIKKILYDDKEFINELLNK